MRTKSWRQGYSFYDNSEDAASARKPVAIYSRRRQCKLQTTICNDFTCHSQYPRIRFCCYDDSTSYWQQSNWNTFGNDSIPVGYLALEDASVNMFPKGKYFTTQQVKDCRIWIYVE